MKVTLDLYQSKISNEVNYVVVIANFVKYFKTQKSAYRWLKKEGYNYNEAGYFEFVRSNDEIEWLKQRWIKV